MRDEVSLMDRGPYGIFHHSIDQNEKYHVVGGSVGWFGRFSLRVLTNMQNSLEKKVLIGLI